jgi:hypothetical protein
MKTSSFVSMLAAFTISGVAAAKSGPKAGDIYKCSLDTEQQTEFVGGKFKIHTSTEDLVEQVKVTKDKLEVTGAHPLTGIIDTDTYALISETPFGVWAVLRAPIGAIRTASLINSNGKMVYTEAATTIFPDGSFWGTTELYICKQLR